MPKTLLILLLLIPSLSWGLTFKDGKQVDGSSSSSTILKNGQSGMSYKTINWGDTSIHGRDSNKEWSQDVKNEFTRIGEFSHRFELRAKDCGGDDCSRGSYEGEYGRTEAGLHYQSSNQHRGEYGENWYAWSFYLDDSELKPFIDEHMFSLGQFKQMYTDEVKKKYSHCDTANDSYNGVTLMFKYKPDHGGLGVSREYCNEKGSYKLVSKYNVVIDKSDLFNKWHDIIFNIKWGDNGYIKLFINGDLQYSETGYISPQVYVSKKKMYDSPTFRYGVYSNNVPKEYTGKLVAWFDGLARGRKCTDKTFSKLLNELGYDCDNLADKDGFVINGEPRCLNCKLELSDFASLASDEDFEDGNYKIEWYWIQLGGDGEIKRNDKLGFDEVIVKDGNLSFTKFSSIKDIRKENRKKIDFKAKDGLILIEGDLDLASTDTVKVNMIAPSEKDENGNYYIEGFWSDGEKIGILFKPLS